MKSNTDYKNAALAALKGNWWKAVLAVVIYMAVYYIAMLPYMFETTKMAVFLEESSSNPDPAALLSMLGRMYAMMGILYLVVFLVGMPLSVGLLNSFRKLLAEGDNAIPENMYKSATTHYWHKVWGMFLMGVFIALWSMLLIIPGIIKTFSYAMTPYILDEHPELSANDAIDRSRAMMKGHKFDLFWLLLSFIGWGILCLFTLGIGFLWLTPYMETSMAAFYEDLKADYEVNGGLI
jgi:uncharacterized membrane protein